MPAPVIFLHGFPFNGSCWDPQIAHLKARGVQAFAPDQRGHGAAESPPGPWLIAHFADDLGKFMDAKGLAKATVCGLSMGGYVALHFAIQNPERVESLVLCDTRGDGDSNEAKDKRFAAIEKVLRGDFKAWAAEFARTALGETTARENPGLVARVEAMILATEPRSVAFTLAALAARRDSTPFLKDIKVPVMVVAGTEDKPTPPAVNEALAKGIPGARFVTIPRAGHLSNLEQPAAFNRELDSFLKI